MNYKCKNFPSVHYTSLYESQDRRKFMNGQFDFYGIRGHAYLTDRFVNIKDNFIIEGPGVAEIGNDIGIPITHINMMRNWYTTCNEEYAIFCEDDISFEIINYWNFTWQEFMQNLPPNWECVQLMRMLDNYDAHSDQLLLDIRRGRYWGTHSIMKRSYVKRILDKFAIGYNHYKFETYLFNGSYLIACPENIMFGCFPDQSFVYNFPILIENIEFPSVSSIKCPNSKKSHEHILNLWKTQGHSLDIKSVLSQVN